MHICSLSLFKCNAFVFKNTSQHNTAYAPFISSIKQSPLWKKVVTHDQKWTNTYTSCSQNQWTVDIEGLGRSIHWSWGGSINWLCSSAAEVFIPPGCAARIRGNCASIFAPQTSISELVSRLLDILMPTCSRVTTTTSWFFSAKGLLPSLSLSASGLLSKDKN